MPQVNLEKLPMEEFEMWQFSMSPRFVRGNLSYPHGWKPVLARLSRHRTFH